MIFKANLAACIIFALAIVAVGFLATRSSYGGVLEVLVVLAAYTSPAWLWAGGAWVARGRRWLSIAWLAASVVLMAVGILALVIDAWNMHQEPPGEEAQHVAGFFAILLQWAAGIVLLAAVGLLRVLTRSSGR